MTGPAQIIGRADGYDDVLTAEALDLVAHIERTFGPGRRALLAERVTRTARFHAGERPTLLPETAEIRAGDWTVAAPPADLVDRRCEITGPTDRKMMVSALNSGARVFMTDFEDSMSPTWTNVLEGQRNVRDAADLSISFERPDGSVDRLAPSVATLIVRPRGLHLEEAHVHVDGRPVSGSLFDVALCALHSAGRLTDRGSGLYLYLPKLEHWTEAAWWHEALTEIEARVGLEAGAIRTTVLVETILAAYQMEEILYALRTRSTGLNAGRWDYIFSIIKKFGADADHVLPDRAQVTMAVPFMAAYARRLVAVCHRHGAHAIGGMSAFIPNRRDPDVTERALAAVRADKEREAGLGYDGTWVAHPDLVAVATEVFDATLGDRLNQLDRVPELEDDVDALLDTAIPGSSTTRAGLVNDVSVALQYLEAWLAGRGAVAINDLMEDAATAEISRSQIWQWVRHGVVLEDGTVVASALVEDVLRAELDTLAANGLDAERLAVAAEVVRQVALSHDLPDFLTLVAGARLG